MSILTTALTLCGFILLMLLITAVLYRRIARWSASEAQGGAGEAELRADAFGRNEIGDLIRSFQRMEGALTTQMQNVATMSAEREKARAELDVATRIQKDMIPSNFESVRSMGKCDIYASMTPAKEVGGDFYDFFPLDEDRLCLVIADVSGKGVPAALFMTISRTLIKQRALAGGTPAQILADVNAQLCADNREMLFVTVWLGIIDTRTGAVACCNAGHEYPVLLSGTATLQKQAPNDPPLALDETLALTDQEIRLQSGDMLFVYTDGVPEAKDSAGARYGMERLMKTLSGSAKNSAASCQEVIESIKNDMSSFVKDGDPFDDVTMLAIRLA